MAGVEQLGATGRGESMEVTTYVEQALQSELQGNLVDLCPVGALTAKPYAYEARSWEMRKTESVDVFDALGANIRIDTRGGVVMRVLPRLNDDVNEEWISDKTRFVWDGLRRQRLDTPYLRKNGKLQPASWQEVFAVVADRARTTRPERMAAIVGDLVIRATAREVVLDLRREATGGGRAPLAMATSLGDQAARLAGTIALAPDGRTLRIEALRSVVLASGDVAGNAELLRTYAADGLDHVEPINPVCAGDGHTMAAAIGAKILARRDFGAAGLAQIRFVPPARRTFRISSMAASISPAASRANSRKKRG